MKVKVCDSMCGSGKTQAAINLMNKTPEKNFLFVTQFLDEVKRIKTECKDRGFIEPTQLGDGKLGSLQDLLEKKRNIASTHSLFRRYDDYVVSLIKNGHYTLILDEVINIVDMLDVHPDDINDAIAMKHIAVGEDDRVYWIDDNYKGYFTQYKKQIQSGHVVMNEGKLLLWLFPTNIFEAFDEVIILTYMFGAQMQKYYYDLNHVEVEYVGVRHVRDLIYEFCDVADQNFKPKIKDKIHIVDDEKLNEIGDPYHALSVSWFKKDLLAPDHPMINKLRNNITNVYINKFKSPSNLNLWTTYKEFKKRLSNKGYATGFLEFTCRAKNDYRGKTNLAYCVNVFMQPVFKNYFTANGVEVFEEKYALSEMIQWVWRSAIRDGKEIWIYVPSSRMRTLFQNWIEEVSE